jgi:hypothetical protein
MSEPTTDSPAPESASHRTGAHRLADLDLEERCGAETRDGTPCEKYPVSGRDRCRFHGGASTGPDDTSYLEGNGHAAGNDGGAPEGNTNTVESGAFVPLDRIPEWLTVAQLHDVARWEWYAVLVSRERRLDLSERRRQRLAARWARLDVRQTTAMIDAWECIGRGFTVERERSVETVTGDEVTVTREVANPSLEVESRATRERMDVGETLGLYDIGEASVEAAERRAAPPVPFREDGDVW